MKKIASRIFFAILALIIVFAIAICAYLVYLNVNYYRIEDNKALQVENNQSSLLQTNTQYTAMTFNVGFGAYTPDWTFFMDTGEMLDGTKTRGTSSKATSKESAFTATEGAATTLETENPDFMLIQEIDTSSDRSRFVNQCEIFKNRFSAYGSSFANNLHTSYLFFPPTDPIGVMNSGLLTLSKFNINSSTRRSYPVSDGFVEKFVDLDRCFQVNRICVEGSEHELVLINSHMSAYDEGGLIREQQMKLISQVLKKESDAGNWVIAGGDWNHALCGSENTYKSEQKEPSWLSIFNEDDLPANFSVVRADNIESVATCRDSDIAYIKDVTYCATVDGFIISDNVIASAQNIDHEYKYSDHNPVKLKFKLLDSSQSQ